MLQPSHHAAVPPTSRPHTALRLSSPHTALQLTLKQSMSTPSHDSAPHLEGSPGHVLLHQVQGAAHVIRAGIFSAANAREVNDISAGI